MIKNRLELGHKNDTSWKSELMKERVGLWVTERKNHWVTELVIGFKFYKVKQEKT